MFINDLSHILMNGLFVLFLKAISDVPSKHTTDWAKWLPDGAFHLANNITTCYISVPIFIITYDMEKLYSQFFF